MLNFLKKKKQIENDYDCTLILWRETNGKHNNDESEMKKRRKNKNILYRKREGAIIILDTERRRAK